MTAVATMKRRRKQQANGNRHLAKLGRPGLPKMMSEAKSNAREARKIMKLKNIQANRNKSKK